MEPLFHSRRAEYRDPFGAVAAGTPVHFRVRLPVEWHSRAVALRVFSADRPVQSDGMFWAGRTEDDAAEWWECHFAPPTPALYYYDFRVETPDGVCVLARGRGGAAEVRGEEGGDRWQLTCYAADFQTPDWLCGGVMYQIFPDRFAASGTPKRGVPTDRVLHESWDEEPEWRPDAQGEIRNCDYFGGDLKGIESKLDYLASLGVTCLYLNPIFEAHSNHRYNTADYRRIDPMLGTAADLRSLCAAAKERGIRILLDGVFSHTGSDSRYFNKEGRYDTLGAYQSTESPYFSWYRFNRWPDDYGGWWGIRTLPEVEESRPDYLAYMTGKDGVLRTWMKSGIGGWRLDVADELPDVFLDALRKAVKAENPDGLVLGEVWEDASNKHSYGRLRRYLLGQQLDSVMNYPFCGAILDFLRGGSSADFQETVGSIVENYPPQVTRLLMNHIGTHDTERALTALGGESGAGHDRAWQATHSLSEAERATAVRRLKSAAVLQYCLPGVPCVYYGDEAGMEGYGDPFCRRTYPWGREDEELRSWYRDLGAMRKAAPVLREGTYIPIESAEDLVAFAREDGDNALLCVVSRASEPRAVALFGGDAWKTVFGSCAIGQNRVEIEPFGSVILVKKQKSKKS